MFVKPEAAQPLDWVRLPARLLLEREVLLTDQPFAPVTQVPHKSADGLPPSQSPSFLLPLPRSLSYHRRGQMVALAAALLALFVSVPL